MLKPTNYVDLYDRLYPEHQLVGLASDSQITVPELNMRLGTIRNNHRSVMAALNGLAMAMPGGAMIRDFMLPFHEIAAQRRFVYSAAEIAGHTFRNGFDAAGEALNLGTTHVVFDMNDLGGALRSEDVLVMVFSDGLEVARSNFVVRTVQGGMMVYVKTAQVVAGVPIDVVVFRKFSQLGVTHSSRFVTVNSGAAVAANYAFTVPRRDQYNLVRDLSTLRVFRRSAADGYFRPVSRNLVTFRTDENESSLSVTVASGAQTGDTFTVVDAAEYWEHYKDGTWTQTEDSRYVVSLVDANGVPAPVWYAKDLDVYYNGRSLIPNHDYWIDWNYERPDLPPQLVIRGIRASSGKVRITAIANAPYDPETEINLTYATIPDQAGVVDVPARDRGCRLLPQLGILRADGRVRSFGDGIQTVAENRGLYLGASLGTRLNVEYRLRFVLTKAGREVMMAAAQGKSPVEQFIELVGSDLGGVDYVGNFKTVNGIQVVPNTAAWTRVIPVEDPGVPMEATLEPGVDPLVDGLGPARATTLDGYTFARTALASVVASGASISIDTREDATFADAYAPQGSVGADWSLDFRPLPPDLGVTTGDVTVNLNERT